MRKWLVAAMLAAVVGLVGAGAASAEGPQLGVFNTNNQVWGCSGDQGVDLPANHCINLRSQGNTGVIKVFAPDTRWPQEGISFDQKANSRPCPHDPDATDGTWWSPSGGAFYVCHHRP